jgi:hypothetical protein
VKIGSSAGAKITMEYKQMLFDACSSHSEPRLLQLAALKDPEISKAIAQNVFMTEAVASAIFAEYPHELLSNTTFTRLGKLNPQFMQDLFASNYRIVSDLILPITWFRYLLSHTSPDVRRAAASNPNLPKQLHEQCVTSQDTALRMGIANNSSIAYNLLCHLRGDADSQVQAIAQQNPGNFSLTIKLPNPAPPVVTSLNTAQHNGFNGNNNGAGLVNDFVEPSMTELQAFETPRSTALTKLQVSNSAVMNRGLPMLIITALSLLSLGLLATLWMLLSQRNPLAPASANLLPATQTSEDRNAADLAKMNQAIEIANAASLAAKQFPNKPGWKAISKQWSEAIDLLNKIPTDSKIYTAAQAKISSYRVILATAKQNAR